MIGAVFVLFVSAADPSGAATRALVMSLHQALGREVAVVVRELPADAGDGDLPRAARREGAVGAARLLWEGPGQLAATVQVHLVRADRTRVERVIFRPTDPLAERGRTLGLVIGSYLVPLASGSRPPPLAGAPARIREARPPRPPPSSAEAFGVGGVALGGAGAGFGAGIAWRQPWSQSWGLRLGGRVSTGRVAAAEADLLAAAVSLGLFRVLDGELAPGRASLVGRVDVLWLHESLSRAGNASAALARRSGSLPGAAAMLEMAIPLGSRAAFCVGAGVDAAFGATRVVVQGRQVATLAPLRGVAEVGLRAGL